MAKNRAAVASTPVSDAAAIVALAAASQRGDSENRFLPYFPIENVIFKSSIQNPGKPWSDGTVARTLAIATLELGNTGLLIPNCRIQHLKFTNGAQKFDLMLPTTPRAQGAVHIAVFDAGKGTDVEADLSAYKTMVVDRWLAERRAAVKAGAPSIAQSIRNSGVTVDDSMLAELGMAEAPKPADTPAQPAATATNN